ncbi:uncharacterized protein [Littorina saxatilis]|uniref:Uncharacterized protein n=1 Tax=Littorina saxatilis TaxID=31220 RepID=A0AAN9GG50_9CAEN
MAMPRLKKRNQHFPDLWKVFYFSVLILTKVTVAKTQCARFDFPSLSSNLTVTAGKESVVTFPFELQTDRCPGDTSQPHHVYVKGPSSHHDHCVVRLADSTCSNVVNDKHCPCAESGGAAVFNKTVSEADAGVWTWRTGDGVSKTVEVVFNILTAVDRNGTSVPSFNHDVISTTASNNLHDTTFSSTQNNKGFSDIAVEKSVDQGNTAGNDGTKTNTENNDGDDDHDKTKSKQMVDDSNMTKDKDDAADDEGDDGDEPLQGSVITGVIFVCVNIFTIVVVAFIIVTVRKRRKRKREGVVNTAVPARRRPNATLPLPPSNGQYDVTTPKRQEQEHESRTSHNYLSLQGRLSSRIYDEIPAGKERTSEGYLTPVSLQARASQNAYDVVV